MPSLKIAVQMDPLEQVNPKGDSTFALMLEAQARGHTLYEYHVNSLRYETHPESKGFALLCQARQVQVFREGAQHEGAQHAQFSPYETLDLGQTDVVLMRQDPPFDMGYISATYMLERIHGIGEGKTLIVNNPRAVRDAPEKLVAMNFPALMPPTLVTWSSEAIKAFRAEHGDIILKPLYGNGGVGIFRLSAQDENLSSLLEFYFSTSREPLMVQRFVPAVKAGDKRIILVDGEVAGAINRMPQEGEIRSNMHVGGVAQPIGLTERDKEICTAIGPFLKREGLIFVGIDVIGEWLTEINVTSPTGIQELDRFNHTNTAALVWQAIESKFPS
ncbi:glutathione synthase [Entomobacter blattae]|nr:glutathione synthase [Entomobacter blattae]